MNGKERVWRSCGVFLFVDAMVIGVFRACVLVLGKREKRCGSYGIFIGGIVMIYLSLYHTYVHYLLF